jgi:hypothetical protein
VSSDGFDEPDRSQPAYQEVLEEIREAVSDRGRGVRSRGQRLPTRGAPESQEMNLEMQYLVSVIGDTPGRTTPEEQAAIEVFDGRLKAEGCWVFAGGLDLPGSATVVDSRGGEAMFTDGPFVESKEYLAGFWILEAPDLYVALRLAAEGPGPATPGSRCGRSCKQGRRHGAVGQWPADGVVPPARVPG